MRENASVCINSPPAPTPTHHEAIALPSGHIMIFALSRPRRWWMVEVSAAGFANKTPAPQSASPADSRSRCSLRSTNCTFSRAPQFIYMLRDLEMIHNDGNYRVYNPRVPRPQCTRSDDLAPTEIIITKSEVGVSANTCMLRACLFKLYRAWCAPTGEIMTSRDRNQI